MADDTPVGARQVSAVLSTYAEWNPEDYGEFYVSPGLVDCNVRVNSEWETQAEVTKTAVSGGVTFLLVEDCVYGQTRPDSEIYCDVGDVQVISVLRDFHPSDTVFAHKIYRYPPSSYVQNYAESFEALCIRITERNSTLIVDSSLPDQRNLILGSPYRHASLMERQHGKNIDQGNFTPGAYQDESKAMSSSDSEEEDLPCLVPNRTRSSMDEFPKDLSNGQSLDKSNEGTSPEKRIGKSKELEELPLKHFETFPTLIENLDRVIRFHGSSASPLSQAELLSYDNAGEYVYSGVQIRPIKRVEPETDIHSLDTLKSPPIGSVAPATEPVKPCSERLQARRPASVVVTPINRSPAAISKDREYTTHLANIPDHWEVAGLRKVLKMIGRVPCKVHFANMSAASAVNEVRAFLQHYPHANVTVETCPHYLFFTMEEILSGETRLKTFPPIRNKTNCNLLWELLKVKCIDVIASAHAALSPELKFLDTGSFRRALSGVNTIGHALQVVWTKLRMPSVDSNAVKERYLVRMAKWLSLNPAKVLGIASKRGSIEPGKLADFVIWQPDELSHQPEVKYPDLNPYLKKTLYGRIEHVYVRGQLAYSQGQTFPVGRKCQKADYTS